MLTAKQEEVFSGQGYLRLQHIIPDSLLQKLRSLFEEMMCLDCEEASRVIIENKGKNYVTNLEEVCSKGNFAALELLGYPPILEIAQAICGDDFFMIQEFAVIKNLGDELPVLWHKDMAHKRKGRCFTMGIYLDDANENDGALRVIPGSHLSDESICELSKQPFIELPVKAGDVLIHDMLLAHSSAPLQHNKIRRVLYFEFLSAAHVRAENIYTEALVQRRTRLIYAASRLFTSLHPDEEKFILPEQNPAPTDNEKQLADIINEIYSQPINARPSEYCLENRSIYAEF
jgi:Phytanoyl-CoA dioxygenase (PhyH)